MAHPSIQPVLGPRVIHPAHKLVPNLSLPTYWIFSLHYFYSLLHSFRFAFVDTYKRKRLHNHPRYMRIERARGVLIGTRRRKAAQEMEAGGETDAAAPPRVLAVLTHVLERLVARNDQIGPEADRWAEKAQDGRLRGLEAFRAPRPPSISVGKYLERIHRYTDCSPSCFVVAFVYIDRAVHRNPRSLVVSLNVHRLLLTSVLIASKVLDDSHHNNAFFAKVGGVSNAELNQLELKLLFLLDFRVIVSSRTFESYWLHLEKEMMGSMTNQKITRAISDDPLDEVERLMNGSRENLSPPYHSID